MAKKKNPFMGFMQGLAIFLGIVVLVGLITEYTGLTHFTAIGEPVQQTGLVPTTTGIGAGALQTNIGEQANITFGAWTGPWGSVKTESSASPTYTVIKKGDGNPDSKVITDATATSTIQFSVGETGALWVTGASYYLDPATGNSLTFSVDSATPNVRVQVIDVTAVTGPQITIRDKNDDALTADDNANNTADYAGGDVSTTIVDYLVKFEQQTADKAFYVGAVCTYYTTGQEADDYTIERTEDASVFRYNPSTASMEDVSNEFKSVTWKEVSIPKKMKDATITAHDDGNVSTTMSYKHCYEPSKPIMLLEGDWIQIRTEFDPDDTTEPSANGDTYIGGGFMDYACDKPISGVTPFCGWVRYGDGTEDPGVVGLDENSETNHTTLNRAWQVEPN